VRFAPLARNFTHHCIEIMWPFKKKETASIHIDYIANPKYVSEMEEDFKNKLSELKSEILKPCCSRFTVAVSDGEIRYAYENVCGINDIDETAWFIEGKWHIYFCPFCGKDIRGVGFGSYHKEIDI
jgi:hypothetical protein